MGIASSYRNQPITFHSKTELAHLQPVKEELLVKGPPCPLLLLNLGDGGGLKNDLYHPYLVTGGEAAVGHHPVGRRDQVSESCSPGVNLVGGCDPLEVESSLLPESVHDSHNLQCQHVLAKVWK